MRRKKGKNPSIQKKRRSDGGVLVFLQPKSSFYVRFVRKGLICCFSELADFIVSEQEAVKTEGKPRRTGKRAVRTRAQTLCGCTWSQKCCHFQACPDFQVWGQKSGGPGEFPRSSEVTGFNQV